MAVTEREKGGMKRSCKVEDRQPECKNKRKRLRRKENRKNRDENRSRHDLNENLVGKGTHDNPSSHTPKNMTDEIEVIVIDDEDVKVIDNDEGGEKTVVDAEPCEEERAGLRQLERVRVWRLTGLGEALASNNTRPGPADTRLRVLSYNLLAPVYATRHPELYRGVAASTLAWPRRWAGIQREVVAHQPDLLALQEVQMAEPDLYTTDLLPWLESRGYSGTALRRTGGKEDGCAVFWRRQTWRAEAVQEVKLRRAGVVVLDKDNVGLVVRLVSRTGARLVLATTHLLFNPRRHDIRLAQAALLLAEVDRVSRAAPGRPAPVILTGDFNLEAGSPAHRLLVEGGVRVGRPGSPPLLPRSLGVTDGCRVAGRGVEESWDSGTLYHGLGLRAVEQGGVSSRHRTWAKVDYILYSTLPARPGSSSWDGRREGRLRLVGRLRLPGPGQAEQIGPLPSPVCPSDHFPLLADFLLRP